MLIMFCLAYGGGVSAMNPKPSGKKGTQWPKGSVRSPYLRSSPQQPGSTCSVLLPALAHPQEEQEVTELTEQQHDAIVNAIYDDLCRKTRTTQASASDTDLIEVVRNIIGVRLSDKARVVIRDLINKHEEEAYDAFFYSLFKNAEILGGLLMMIQMIDSYSQSEGRLLHAYHKALAVRYIECLRNRLPGTDEAEIYAQGEQVSNENPEGFKDELLRRRFEPDPEDAQGAWEEEIDKI